MTTDATGHMDSCFFCHGVWGKCTCKFPSVTNNDGTMVDDVDAVPGFDWKDFYVTEPNVSVCGRFFVDPFVYYGDAYRAFVKNQETGTR